MEQVSENKIQFVDALRGIAIMGVLIIHCGQFGTNSFSSLQQNIIIHGAIGVQLFFVASAFTIFLTYRNRYDKEHSPVANFLLRRFFRIAPMYYLGIVYFLWQEGLGNRYWLGDAPYVSSWNIASNILFVHGIYPYWITSIVPGGWSIAVEVCFYCLVPILFQRIRNLNQAFVLFLGTIFLRMMLQGLLQNILPIGSEHLWREYLFFYPPNQFPVFACGIILYYLVYTRPENWHIEPRVLFVFCLLILVQLLTRTAFIFPTHVQFAMAFAILGYVLSRKSFLILVNPITIYLGKISYSMYLVHFALMHWFIKLGYVDFATPGIQYYYPVNYLLRLGSLLLFTVLVSCFTYYIIEVPFQNIGKRIVRRREALQVKSLELAS